MLQHQKENSKPLKVAIAAGGTAGHLVPALALADALTARGARVFFIGTGRGLETQLVPRGADASALVLRSSRSLSATKVFQSMKSV